MSNARSDVKSTAGDAGTNGSNPASAAHINRRAFMAGAGGFAATVALAPWIAVAQSPFFVGQRIEILSNASEGSSENGHLQEFARAIERLYPGTSVVARANTGGTSALAAAMLAAAAPDGLTMGSSDMDSLLQRASQPDLHAISEFTMIGSMRRSSAPLFASAASGIETVDDLVARTEPALLGVRSTASSGYLSALFANAMLGTRILPVTGYGSAERDLAFLNGEVDLILRTPDAGVRIIEDGTGRAVLRFDDTDIPALFGAPPALSQFDYDPAYQWIVDYLNASTYSRILGVPDGVPADRVAALRELFVQVMAEPGFIAAVEGSMTITPTRGEDLQAAVDSLSESLGDPTELGERVQRILDCGLQVAQTGEACPAAA